MILFKNLQQNPQYEILDEQEDFIIVYKHHGIAVQATDIKQNDIEGQLKEKFGKNIFVLNRIDQPVSGLVIFGKNKRFAELFTEMLKSRVVKKTYLALVSGHPNAQPTELTHYIKKLHNRAMTADEQIDDNYKEAILNYTLLQSFDKYHLLKIDLKTGRFHQIRAQMATMELTIKGDLKYGSKRPNIDKSIGLLSYKLAFTHPDTGKEYKYTSPLPTNDVLWGLIDPAKLDFD